MPENPGNDQSLLSKLSGTLFWDTEVNSIDPDRHAPYIIERVMTRGTLDDFKHIKAFYGKAKIEQIVTNLRYLDDRTIHFCSAYFKVPLSQFRSYKLKQSGQANWNY